MWILFGIYLLINFWDSAIELNEIGDFVAGWVAPLAFFWLILGYYQQKEELNLNTEAITAQKLELQKQVQALEIQSEALKKSANALHEYSRPYISISFHIEHRNVFLEIANSGIRTAYFPKFSFSKPLKKIAENHLDHEGFLNIKSLAPNQKIVHYLSNMPMIISKKGNKDVLFETEVNFSYKDKEGELYKDEAILNLNIIKNNVILPKSTQRSLQELVEIIKETKRKLENKEII